MGTSEASYPVCIALKKTASQEGFAVGLLNKTIKYYSIDSNESNNPLNWEYKLVESTTIDNFLPRFIEFHQHIAYVSFDDCTKVILFGDNREKKPRVLDILQKPYGKVLDFKFSHDFS